MCVCWRGAVPQPLNFVGGGGEWEPLLSDKFYWEFIKQFDGIKPMYCKFTEMKYSSLSTDALLISLPIYLYIIYLRFFSNLGYIYSIEWTDEWWIGNGMEERLLPNLRYYPAFTWRDWEKLRKSCQDSRSLEPGISRIRTGIYCFLFRVRDQKQTATTGHLCEIMLQIERKDST